MKKKKLKKKLKKAKKAAKNWRDIADGRAETIAELRSRNIQLAGRNAMLRGSKIRYVCEDCGQMVSVREVKGVARMYAYCKRCKRIRNVGKREM